MTHGRLSALRLLAELAAQPGHSVATRVCIGMSRDALLGLDETEPASATSDHRASPTSVGDVLAYLNALVATSPQEEVRLRIAMSWLRAARPLL